jgi:hypothetical protein
MSQFMYGSKKRMGLALVVCAATATSGFQMNRNQQGAAQGGRRNAWAKKIGKMAAATGGLLFTDLLLTESGPVVKLCNVFENHVGNVLVQNSNTLEHAPLLLQNICLHVRDAPVGTLPENIHEAHRELEKWKKENLKDYTSAQTALTGQRERSWRKVMNGLREWSETVHLVVGKVTGSESENPVSFEEALSLDIKDRKERLETSWKDFQKFLSDPHDLRKLPSNESNAKEVDRLEAAFRVSWEKLQRMFQSVEKRPITAFLALATTAVLAPDLEFVGKTIGLIMCCSSLNPLQQEFLITALGRLLDEISGFVP